MALLSISRSAGKDEIKDVAKIINKILDASNLAASQSGSAEGTTLSREESAEIVAAKKPVQR
jgi:hypothetical protein